MQTAKRARASARKRRRMIVRTCFVEREQLPAVGKQVELEMGWYCNRKHSKRWEEVCRALRTGMMRFVRLGLHQRPLHVLEVFHKEIIRKLFLHLHLSSLHLNRWRNLQQQVEGSHHSSIATASFAYYYYYYCNITLQLWITVFS